MTRLSIRELCEWPLLLGEASTVVRPPTVPEGSVVTVLRVPPESAGMRVDRFVQTQLHRTSRTRAATIIEQGAYSLNAKPLHKGDRVHAEQCILLWRKPWDEQAPDIELPILYEDDDLLAIDKPPRIPVHPTARYHKSTVIKMLETARPGERLFLAHRLDRETSGVLLLSKTPGADRRIKAQLEERTGVVKRYLTIVWGNPTHEAFRVDLPLEIDPTSRLKIKMRVAKHEGLCAATTFQVLDRLTHPQTGQPYALLLCTLETGRQHQIRVHLSAQNLPVVGDKLYGPDEGLFIRAADGLLTDDDRTRLELERHALHATILEFVHPTGGHRVHIESPLTQDLKAFWDGLKGLEVPCPDQPP